MINTFSEKKKEQQCKEFTNGFAEKQSNSGSSFQFVVNRPEAVTQRKLQEMAHTSTQVKQLEVYQARANNRPQISDVASLLALINNSSHMLAQQQPVASMSGGATQRQEASEDEELQMKSKAASIPRVDVEGAVEKCKGRPCTPPALNAGSSWNKVLQGYFIIGKIDSDPIKEVPSEVHKAVKEAKGLNKLLNDWFKDDQAHIYENWNAVKKALLNMHSQRMALKDIRDELSKNVNTIMFDFDTFAVSYSPIWIEKMHRALIFLTKAAKDWVWDKNWIKQYEASLRRLSTLVSKPEIEKPGKHKLSGRKKSKKGHGQPVGDESSKPIEHEDVPHLHGIMGKLKSRDYKKRYAGIGEIRGVDDEEYMQEEMHEKKVPPFVKGAIFAPFIQDNRKAILNLVEMLGDSVAIFSLERGGALVADHIENFQKQLLNVKVPKPFGGREGYTRKQHHLNLVTSMMDTEEGMMFKMLSKNPLLLQGPPPKITVALAETAISGSSVNTLLKTINAYHDLLPQTKFRLLVEKQTIKEDRLKPGTAGGIKVHDPGIKYTQLVDTANISKIEMFIAHTQYILGEDVGYQVSYKGMHEGQPLVIFDEESNNIIAIELSSLSQLPRDLIIKLVGGAYDKILGAMLKGK